MPFSTFAGNEKVKTQLASLVETGHVPHAILFEGETGLGKRTLARLLACALVCKAESGKPCLACSACKKVLSGGHPDVMEASGGATARSFHVDTVRKVKADAYILPNEAPYKVYILANAHTMSEQAQNALLKVLEEPPGYAVFLLTCNAQTEMLPTVLSRSSIYALQPVSEQEAIDYARSALPEASLEELGEAARIWAGNIGKMLDGMGDGTLKKALLLCGKVADSLLSRNEYDLLALSGVFEKEKELLDAVLRLLVLLLRDALVAGSGGTTSLSGRRETACRLARELTPKTLAALLDAVEELQSMRLRNMNHTLLITRFCYALRRAAGR